VELMPKTALPKTIGRYEIVREIGRGAMGIVYEGRDLSLMRPVALKTLLLEPIADELRETFEKRFYQEARAAASLQHPCIVVVYEIGIDAAAEAFFMSLEFLRGRTLEDLIAEGPLPWRDALRIASRLADALSHAHENGIVHRDIKPGNVMILKKGEPKIMDFGVAKLDSSKLTSQGDVLGSPGYMAPEQALEARVDARSDLFSLGTVLYESLTGKRAFGTGTFSEILMRLAYEHPTPPSRIVKDLPKAVDDIVAHALAKNPDERYAKADHVVEDIEDALAERPLRHAASRGPAPVSGPASVSTPGMPSLRTPTASVAVEQVTSAGVSTADAPARPVGLPRGPLNLPPGKRVSLSLLSGPKEGAEHVLRHASLLIGREGGNSGAAIELAETQVSRMHAMVEARGTRFVLRDLESKNGTFMGTERVKEVEIHDGTEFQIGGTRFVLRVTDA
jgi:serine/threonine-protein kinase